MGRSAVDSSKCLDISGANIQEGRYLQVWDCDFGETQLWDYDAVPGRIYHCKDGDCTGAAFCVDVPNDDVGSEIQIFGCNNEPGQSWKLGPSSLPAVPVPAVE